MESGTERLLTVPALVPPELLREHDSFDMKQMAEEGAKD
jgi:hypothetical protein